MPAKMDIETIALESKISDRLRAACAARSPLHIDTGAEGGGRLMSRFQDIHAGGDLLVEPIDQEGGDIELRNAGKVTVSFIIDLYRYEFDTRFVELITSGLPAIRLLKPEALRRIQLRNYYRVRPSDSYPLVVQLSGGSFTSAPGKYAVCDLSEGGLSCERKYGGEVPVGARVGSLMFSLPNGYVIKVSGTVKRASSTRNEQGTVTCHYGIEFDELEKTDRLMLVDFIFERQREEIRKRKEGY